LNPPPASLPAVLGSEGETKQQSALADWSKRGLNTTTRARLPINIVATQSTYDDQLVANDLSATLENTFHVVKKSEAALSVEISNMRVQIDLSGQPCTDPSDEAEHIGRASLNIKGVWTSDGGTMFGERSIPAVAKSCKATDAAADARDQLLQKVKDFLLALSNN
jgi:hypothetical protein